MNNRIIYRDFNMNMIPHPSTGDIGSLTNHNAIAQSIKNLVLTNFYERLHDSDKAGHISGMLFENANYLTEFEIKKRIESIIELYEPRIDLQSVLVTFDVDSNGFDVRIQYVSSIATDVETINIFLERVI